MYPEEHPPIFADINYEEVHKAIQTLEDLMPFLVNLTAEKKKSLIKLGDKSLPFVQKCHELAVQNPDFLPRNFRVEDMSRDLDVFNKLFNVQLKMNILMEKIEDTYKEAGSNAYTSALTVYSSAKISGKSLGGMESILDELGKRFAKKNSHVDLTVHQGITDQHAVADQLDATAK